MEINAAGLESSGDLSSQKWAMVQVSRRQRALRGRRADEVKEELSQLLYGLDLDLGQLQSYRMKLLTALDLADELASFGGNLNLDQGRVSAEKRIFRMGNAIWHPGKPPENPITSTAEHQLHSLQVVSNLERLRKSIPQGERRTAYSVGIVVARNFEGVRAGADEVQLTSGGFQALTDPDKVVHLRLPPRFPREADFLSLAAG